MKREIREGTEAELAEMEEVERAVMAEFPPATELQRLATRLRVTRERRGITLPELAERTGIDLDELSRIETGKRSPSWETLGRYAAGLDMRAVLELVPHEAATA